MLVFLRSLFCGFLLFVLLEQRTKALTGSEVVRLSPIETVVLSGERAAGTEPFVAFTNFSAPILDNYGNLTFEAGITARGLDPNRGVGIWTTRNSTVKLVAREGQEAPGTSGFQFDDFENFAVSETGQLALTARLAGEGTTPGNREGIWTFDGTSLDLLVRAGQQADGVPELSSYRTFEILEMNTNGHVFFEATIEGSNSSFPFERGIWRSQPNGLQPLVRAGDTVPGFADTSFISISGMRGNQKGELVFFASTSSSGNAEGPLNGIWSFPADSSIPHPVVSVGEQAGVMEEGVVWSRFNDAGINNRGEVAFEAMLAGPGVDRSNDEGIWVSGQSTRLVARTGQQAPGTDPGVVFNAIPLSPPRMVFGEQGVVFTAALRGPNTNFSNNSGIWAESSRGLQLVARAGDPAPGTSPGTVFSFFAFLPLTSNDLGQTAFVGLINDVEVELPNQVGIWTTNRQGELQLVVRTGDELEVAPGDRRTIQSLTFSSRSNSRSRIDAFNNRGQLAFNATFTDGSQGIFISNLVAIPEPSTSVLVAIFLVLVCSNRYFRPVLSTAQLTHK